MDPIDNAKGVVMDGICRIAAIADAAGYRRAKQESLLGFVIVAVVVGAIAYCAGRFL